MKIYWKSDTFIYKITFFSFHLLAGELRVTQAGQDLRTLTTGDVFGELAILYNCKRTATVKGQPL